MADSEAPPNRMWALVHQSWLTIPRKKRPRIEGCRPEDREAWRLKNIVDHPIDPGWDIGTYCLCHPHFRNSKTLLEGGLVLDLVRVGKCYHLRSAFTVKDVRPCILGPGNDLHFKRFWFADGWPFTFRVEELRNPRVTNTFDPTTCQRIWKTLGDSSCYGHYSVGECPKSISGNCWAEMSSWARKGRSELA